MKVISKQVSYLDQFQKLMETRTNAMLKVIINYIKQYSEKIGESLASLISIIMNCLVKLSDASSVGDKSPDRRKQPHHGDISFVFKLTNSLSFWYWWLSGSATWVCKKKIDFNFNY